MAARETTAAQPPATGVGSAFLSRDFRLYQLARLLVILGAEAQSVAVAWQVYAITHSAFKLGLTGLTLFAPGIVFILAAGHVADRYDRRAIILCCYSLQAVCTLALLEFATPLPGGPSSFRSRTSQARRSAACCSRCRCPESCPHRQRFAGPARRSSMRSRF
jgi:hypothetical protein